MARTKQTARRAVGGKGLFSVGVPRDHRFSTLPVDHGVTPVLRSEGSQRPRMDMPLASLEERRRYLDMLLRLGKGVDLTVQEEYVLSAIFLGQRNGLCDSQGGIKIFDAPSFAEFKEALFALPHDDPFAVTALLLASVFGVLSADEVRIFLGLTGENANNVVDLIGFNTANSTHFAAAFDYAVLHTGRRYPACALFYRGHLQAYNAGSTSLFDTGAIHLRHMPCIVQSYVHKANHLGIKPSREPLVAAAEAGHPLACKLLADRMMEDDCDYDGAMYMYERAEKLGCLLPWEAVLRYDKLPADWISKAAARGVGAAIAAVGQELADGGKFAQAAAYFEEARKAGYPRATFLLEQIADQLSRDIPGRWTPFLHPFFTGRHSVRTHVLVLLMMARRQGTPFSGLPRDIVQLMCSYLVSKPWNPNRKKPGQSGASSSAVVDLEERVEQLSQQLASALERLNELDGGVVGGGWGQPTQQAVAWGNGGW